MEIARILHTDLKKVFVAAKKFKKKVLITHQIINVWVNHAMLWHIHIVVCYEIGLNNDYEDVLVI